MSESNHQCVSENRLFQLSGGAKCLFTTSIWQVIEIAHVVYGSSFCAKFDIPNSPQSLDIGQNSRGFRFPDFWPIPYKQKLSRTSHNIDVVAFFQFIGNLQPSVSRIPQAWNIKRGFSLIATFYLTKLATRTKKFLIQLSYYCFLQKKPDIA